MSADKVSTGGISTSYDEGCADVGSVRPIFSRCNLYQFDGLSRGTILYKCCSANEYVGKHVSDSVEDPVTVGQRRVLLMTMCLW